MKQKLEWLDFKVACTLSSLLSVIALWSFSQIPDVLSVWSKPLVVIFVMFTVITMSGFLIGYIIDHQKKKDTVF